MPAPQPLGNARRRFPDDRKLLNNRATDQLRFHESLNIGVANKCPNVIYSFKDVMQVQVVTPHIQAVRLPARSRG